MKGEWCYFRNYFKPTDCERIIRDAATIPSQDGVVGLGDQGHVNLQTRRSKIKFINKDNWQFTWLFDELWKLATQANNDWFNVHISRLDFIQLGEYRDQDQGEYRTHHDVFWINGDPVYHRKLSCVIQLTDPSDYEGGDFELDGVSEYPPALEIREQGTVIFFPSMFNHRANRVTRGTRRSIAAWFEGPKWR